jgi:hypothetical protein
MPRKNNGADSTLRTREWRKRLREVKRPETDAVDTALAVAVALYAHTAELKQSERDRTRITALEQMAVRYLVSRGSSLVEAERMVRRRVRRLDVDSLIPMVNGSASPSSR